MTHADQFLERSREFIARAEQLGLAAAARYYWYHTVDLGDGLITPGMYDYRETITAFEFPEDMRGMTVLDVGSATGFFAFEFERRGARVISVEPPSLDLVFFGDVLIHTLYPLKALAALAGLCRGTLVFAGVLPEGPQEPPTMVYIGGSDAADDEVAWWHPNLSCLSQMLSKPGFAQVEKVGFHKGLLNPSGWEFERVVLRAQKRLP